MGVGSRSHAWRFSDINHDYEVSSSFSRSHLYDSLLLNDRETDNVKLSSAQRIPARSSYPPRSPTPLLDTPSSIAQRVDYLDWSICTGRISFVISALAALPMA